MGIFVWRRWVHELLLLFLENDILAYIPSAIGPIVCVLYYNIKDGREESLLGSYLKKSPLAFMIRPVNGTDWDWA